MKFFLLFLFVAAAAFPALAQDGESCDVEAAVSGVIEQLETGAGDLETLTEAANALTAARAACDGLVFEGEAGTVLGPVEIPAGLYRAVVETDGFFIAHVQALDGECDSRGSLFNETPSATGTVEKLFESAGCRAVIEVENITAPWALRLEVLE